MKKILQFAERDVIADFLQQHLVQDENVVIAISGGPDSMFCTAVVRHWRTQQGQDIKNIKLIYCDHATRDTSKDIQVIKKYFGDLSLQVEKKNTGGQKEQELRKRRHATLAAYAETVQAQCIILGHNLTDRVESSLLHMLRGADVVGFVAMRAYEQDHGTLKHTVCRPLLHLAKPYIQELCDANNIPYVIDPTNKDNTTSRRNQLRNDILRPLYSMAHQSKGNKNTFLQSMERLYAYLESNQITHGIQLQEITQHPARQAQGAYKRLVSREAMTHSDLAQVLRHLQISRGMTHARLQELWQFLREKKSGYKYLQGVYFFISHNIIYSIKAPRNFWQQELDEQVKIKQVGKVNFDGQSISVIHKERIGCTICYAKAGMKYGSKSRTKRCINHKIPVFWRNFIPLVLKDGKIIHAQVPDLFMKE